MDIRKDYQIKWSSLKFNTQTPLLYVTVRAKTSLVHTSKFTTSVLYNFSWERSTELKFAMLLY